MRFRRLQQREFGHPRHDSDAEPNSALPEQYVCVWRGLGMNVRGHGQGRWRESCLN